jgi:hypothetical protein
MNSVGHSNHQAKTKLLAESVEKTAACLTRYGNKPSSGQIMALQSIAETLNSMAFHEAAPMYYISSLEAGQGKTTLIAQWIDSMLSMAELSHVGIIVCFDRHQQIWDFIQMGSFDPLEYGVLISRSYDPLNLRIQGIRAPNKARILLATKEQIRRSVNEGNFNDLAKFHYKGLPRLVRIWDESFMLGSPLRLSVAKLGLLLDAPTGPEASQIMEHVKDLLEHLREYKDGNSLQMPSLGKSRKQMVGYFEHAPLHMRELANDFWMLSGRGVAVRDYNHGKVLIDCVRAVPSGLEPLLITDASARFRGTYKLLRSHVQNHVD